ncbi:hypothetical protein [Paraburkholderia sp. J76]|uniref:hypothetical protein n=1 Tax=Paraburkholderia sp. J76 TaxID=2805439 RepID=UPI002ABE5C0A|nr:hypothetical protein [Paraburkholderia sp. J76]
MSTYNVTQPNVKVAMDNATFDVQAGASLNLTGSWDTVTLENGTQGLTINGNDNQVNAGSMPATTEIDVYGSANAVNVASLGAYASVNDYGVGDTFTLGAGYGLNPNGMTSYFDEEGTNGTVYALQGGVSITADGAGGTYYANNDRFWLTGAVTSTISGNGNVLYGMSSGSQLVNLSGTNNTVALNSAMQVATSGGTVTDNNNVLVLTGNIAASGVTLTGGVASVQLGNGNVATLSGVASGSQIEYVDASGHATWTTLTDSGLSPANQLTAAMASYSNGAAGASYSTVGQPAVESSLFASAHQ